MFKTKTYVYLITLVLLATNLHAAQTADGQLDRLCEDLESAKQVLTDHRTYFSRPTPRREVREPGQAPQLPLPRIPSRVISKKRLCQMFADAFFLAPRLEHQLNSVDVQKSDNGKIRKLREKIEKLKVNAAILRQNLRTKLSSSSPEFDMRDDCPLYSCTKQTSDALACQASLMYLDCIEKHILHKSAEHLPPLHLEIKNHVKSCISQKNYTSWYNPNDKQAQARRLIKYIEYEYDSVIKENDQDCQLDNIMRIVELRSLLLEIPEQQAHTLFPEEKLRKRYEAIEHEYLVQAQVLLEALRVGVDDKRMGIRVAATLAAHNDCVRDERQLKRQLFVQAFFDQQLKLDRTMNNFVHRQLKRETVRENNKKIDADEELIDVPQTHYALYQQTYQSSMAHLQGGDDPESVTSLPPPYEEVSPEHPCQDHTKRSWKSALAVLAAGLVSIGCNGFGLYYHFTQRDKNRKRVWKELNSIIARALREREHMGFNE